MAREIFCVNSGQSFDRPVTVKGIPRHLTILSRIPRATCHRQIPEWCGARPRLLVMNRVDMISDSERSLWTADFGRRKTPVYWTNSKSGVGIPQVQILYHHSHSLICDPVCHPLVFKNGVQNALRAAEVFSMYPQSTGLSTSVKKWGLIKPHLLLRAFP